MIVSSSIELYTTVLGWFMFNSLWDLLTGTVVALIPFAFIVIRNLIEARKSRDKTDIGVQAFARSEIELYVVLRRLTGTREYLHDRRPGALFLAIPQFIREIIQQPSMQPIRLIQPPLPAIGKPSPVRILRGDNVAITVTVVPNAP